MNGKISDIETMGLADGPGMRLVLFLSGCKLRCKYCHNPETWTCDGANREITSEEVLKIYNKYKNYYGETGGITFSGGEPLLQKEFLLETIKLLKENGIHTAIDTAGVADGYDEILDIVDLVILDIKAVNADEYKFITGRDIEDFKKFLMSCQQKNKKLWIRQVIVPGINDDEKHILLLKEFLIDIKNVEKVELLPYHSMAETKYKSLGIEYAFQGIKDMEKSKCIELEKLLK